MPLNAYTASDVRMLARTGIVVVKFLRSERPRRQRLEAGPEWAGGMFRVMICTLCPTILFSPSGVIGMNFRRIQKGKRRTYRTKAVASNVVTVWDVLWQNWRCIKIDHILNMDYTKIGSKFDDTELISLIKQVKLSHPEYTYNLYDTPVELFFNVFSNEYRNLGPSEKYKIMDSKTNKRPSICKLYEVALDNYKKQLNQILKGKTVQKPIQNELMIKGQKFTVDPDGFLEGDPKTWSPDQLEALMKTFGKNYNTFEDVQDDAVENLDDNRIISMFENFIKIDGNRYLKSINGRIKVV